MSVFVQAIKIKCHLLRYENRKSYEKGCIKKLTSWKILHTRTQMCEKPAKPRLLSLVGYDLFLSDSLGTLDYSYSPETDL